MAAEGELARRGDLQPHLVLDIGHEHAVAVGEFTDLRIEMELRYEEQAQPFGAGACALRTRKNEVEDVLGQMIRLGSGDEALNPLDVP